MVWLEVGAGLRTRPHVRVRMILKVRGGEVEGGGDGKCEVWR